MKKTSLDGSWKLCSFPQNPENIETPVCLKDEGQCIDACVPGNVEIDLMKAGMLPDILKGENIYLLQQYELYEHWYQRKFEVPPDYANKEVKLVFHGVDCIATYWLNGTLLGKTQNMFIEHRFDVSNILNYKGENHLLIRIESAVMDAMNREYTPGMFALPMNWEQLWIRKAAHSYGWDIMPRAVSAGLWRSVELEAHEENEIQDIYFYTLSYENNTAKIGMHYQVKMEPHMYRALSLEVSGECGGSSFKIIRELTFCAGLLEFEIENPELWWPRGYGDPKLYKVTVKLANKGQLLDERQETLGIRTVELLYNTSKDSNSNGNGNFLFKINHVPILCKGSNWVVGDMFHSKAASKYQAMLETFADLNCNIVRCWGGGVYEDHKFFEVCDSQGLMVWQDFAMACACYPQEDGFYQTIREEAAAVVKKLRKHPSIILWAGDNECDYMFYEIKGMDPNKNRITREVLPEVIAKYDPYRPYIPSSPFYDSEIVRSKDISLMTEQHLWGPRDYFKSRFYTETTSYFISEIGYHGCPNLSSLRKFLDEEYLWPWENNRQWIAHCTDPQGEKGMYAFRVKLMADQIMELFGEYPDNIEDFIVASQISQAEAKKFFIEMVRLKKWRRTGIIWWNMLDGWPQFSDAIVDYYFGKKLAYHYIKRSQQPICIMLEEPEDWHVRAVLGNDSRMSSQVEYQIRDADTQAVLLKGACTSPANENKELGKIRISRGEHRLFLIEWTADGIAYGSHYILGQPPFSFRVYRRWLEQIARLPFGFDDRRIGL